MQSKQIMEEEMRKQQLVNRQEKVKTFIMGFIAVVILAIFVTMWIMWDRQEKKEIRAKEDALIQRSKDTIKHAEDLLIYGY